MADDVRRRDELISDFVFNLFGCAAENIGIAFGGIPVKVMIIGGAGFIGCNAAKWFLDDGQNVVVVDNLSRAGTRTNLEWLQANNDFTFVEQDIRHAAGIEEVFARHNDVELILHLAGQVAVTTSVVDPRDDMENNLIGTFNVLEAMRKHAGNAVLIYSSTNKVYGGMEDVSVVEEKFRYRYKKLASGVSEKRGLDFHSPYGCSKGAADQYVHDYARIYQLKTVVFRQSCIYGYRQFGVEDQGWVAWFTIASVLGKPLTIFGDGKQVRDVLFIDDLIQGYYLAYQHIKSTSGQVYNIGGGPANTLSLLELIELLSELNNREINTSFSDWRPGDQPVFICDTSKARQDFTWKPRISPQAGVTMLYNWVVENKALFTTT